jgi:hypothetical protein
MTNILQNISILILLCGVIMLTVYITKATSVNFMTHEKILLMNQNMLRRRKPVRDIYDYRVSKEYQKMFSNPEIIMGYQEFDPKDKPTKLYIKN